MYNFLYNFFFNFQRTRFFQIHRGLDSVEYGNWMNIDIKYISINHLTNKKCYYSSLLKLRFMIFGLFKDVY